MAEGYYEVLAFAMRYWFIAVLAIALIAVIAVSISEYRQRSFVMREIGKYIGYLEIEDGPEDLLGIRYSISGENSIGRSRRSDILIDDKSVNKTHALLYKKDDRVILTPLTSGTTKINGRKASKAHIVKNGDIISVGNVDLRLFLKENINDN